MLTATQATQAGQAAKAVNVNRLGALVLEITGHRTTSINTLKDEDALALLNAIRLASTDGTPPTQAELIRQGDAAVQIAMTELNSDTPPVKINPADVTVVSTQAPVKIKAVNCLCGFKSVSPFGLQSHQRYCVTLHPELKKANKRPQARRIPEGVRGNSRQSNRRRINKARQGGNKVAGYEFRLKALQQAIDKQRLHASSDHAGMKKCFACDSMRIRVETAQAMCPVSV